MTTILIADDDSRIRLLLRTILRREGHRVVEAVDGDEALAAIREHRPTIAILDVLMPGRSGLEVCRAARADPSVADTRLIVVSANATEADALGAGADQFLAKPFLPSRILAAIGPPSLAALIAAISSGDEQPPARPDR